MDRKTGRFLILESLALLVIFLMGQFYMYPVRGQSAFESLIEKSTAMFDPRIVLKADLDSSVIYILDIDGFYGEKMFDKSLIFNRYVEKPLILLRPKTAEGSYEFVTKDSANNFLYEINENEEMVLLRKAQKDFVKMLYAALTATVILLGICFGGGTLKKQRF